MQAHVHLPPIPHPARGPEGGLNYQKCDDMRWCTIDCAILALIQLNKKTMKSSLWLVLA